LSNKAASAIPNVQRDMLTFLSRLHGCITYQFSLVEYVPISNVTGYPDEWFVICRLKALLFMLIRVFEFELAVHIYVSIYLSHQ